MSISISYKKTASKLGLCNIVYFVDDKHEIKHLKKYLSISDFNSIKNLLNVSDKDKNILSFDLNIGKKIILVSLKKNLKNFNVENLGAEFFEYFKNLKLNQYSIFTESAPFEFNNLLGHFLHGLKLNLIHLRNIKQKKII